VRLAGEKLVEHDHRDAEARAPRRFGVQAVIAAVHGREMEVHLPGLRGGRRPVEGHLRGAGLRDRAREQAEVGVIADMSGLSRAKVI